MSKEQRAKSSEQRTRSKEQRAKNSEQEARSSEQGAVSAFGSWKWSVLIGRDRLGAKIQNSNGPIRSEYLCDVISLTSVLKRVSADRKW